MSAAVTERTVPPTFMVVGWKSGCEEALTVLSVDDRSRLSCAIALSGNTICSKSINDNKAIQHLFRFAETWDEFLMWEIATKTPWQNLPLSQPIITCKLASMRSAISKVEMIRHPIVSRLSSRLRRSAYSSIRGNTKHMSRFSKDLQKRAAYIGFQIM